MDEKGRREEDCDVERIWIGKKKMEGDFWRKKMEKEIDGDWYEIKWRLKDSRSKENWWDWRDDRGKNKGNRYKEWDNCGKLIWRRSKW